MHTVCLEILLYLVTILFFILTLVPFSEEDISVLIGIKCKFFFS